MKWSRDVILFIVGIAGVVNEAVFRNTERPTLLLLYAAMLGLPIFLRSDEKESFKDKKKGKDKDGDSS